jgi:hypothetical protein
MKGIKILLIALLLAPIFTFGQSEIMYLMNNSYQRSFLNPAMVGDSRVVLSLPSFMIDYNSSGLTFNNITKDGAEPDVKYFDFDQAYQNVNDQNHNYGKLNLEYGSLYFRFGNIGLALGGSFNVLGQIEYADDLIGLLAKGNGAFIGQTLDIGPKLNYQSYNELYLNVAFQLGDVKLGVKGKILNGIQDLSTSKNEIKFTTDNEIYEVVLENDYVINTSALATIDGLDEIEFDFQNFTLNNLLTHNFGFAFDLGLSMPIGSKSEIGLAITDIGSIAWDRRNRNYTSSGTEGFSGLNLVDYIGNSEDIIIEDSLYEIMNFQESRTNYSTALPWNVNLSYVVNHSNRLNYGASLKYGQYNGTPHTVASIFSSYRLLDWWRIGASYSYRNGGFDNFGLMSQMTFGPFQGFIATENIFGFLKPLSAKTVNIRLGGHFNILSKKTIYAKVDELIELK